MLAALAGAGADEIAPVKLGQAAALGHQVLGAERLTGLLGAAIGLPVRVVEFVGDLDGDPVAACRPGWGAPTPGSAATPWSGREASRARTGSSSGSARSVSPTTARCCPGGERLAGLRRAILHGLGETLDVDVRPVLRGGEVPAARLGAAALGHTAWLAPLRDSDADDLRIARGRRPRGRGPRAAA